VSRNKKKKKKIAGQNLSLSERLERNWEGGKWEAFVSLYMRDREASDRGPWAARLPDALYNCLTAALFLRKNCGSARQIAEIMLQERSLGPDDGVLRACARTALDLINIRAGMSCAPSDCEGHRTPLPAPYEELRQRLIDEFAPSKPGKRARASSNPTLEKLLKQFKALPSAKNSALYTNFLKTAEALADEMKGSDVSAVFTVVRDIASIMSGIASKGLRAKNPALAVDLGASGIYPMRAGYPALLTLWEYMCKQGGRRFGADWESTARVARMSLITANEEFRPAYDKLMSLGENHSDEDLPVTAERHYGGWTEQERFVLIFLAITEYLKKSPEFFDNIPNRTILRWFKTLGEIGRRRRSGRAWPAPVDIAFERLVFTGDEGFVETLYREDLPFECMTSATIIAMTLLCGLSALRRLEDKLRHRLPLRINERDERVLGDFFFDTVFPVPALKMTSRLCDRKGRETLFKIILTSIMSADVSQVLEYDRPGPMLWRSVSQAHIELFAENLPEGSQAAAFCALCLGKKNMCLSDDPSKTAAFFATSDKWDSSDGDLLSLFLMTWPGVSAEFLLRLFENSSHERAMSDEWIKIPKIISKIQDPASRKKIAHGVSLTLKRMLGGKMGGWKFVTKALVSLEKNGKLPENYDIGRILLTARDFFNI
jgi:hypothetical protein